MYRDFVCICCITLNYNLSAQIFGEAMPPLASDKIRLWQLACSFPKVTVLPGSRNAKKPISTKSINVFRLMFSYWNILSQQEFLRTNVQKWQNYVNPFAEHDNFSHRKSLYLGSWVLKPLYQRVLGPNAWDCTQVARFWDSYLTGNLRRSTDFCATSKLLVYE